MMASPGARPVMSFEQAMEDALEKVKDRDPGMPNKYDVEVFLRFPFEGESSYKQSYTAPPIEATTRSAGAPTGPYGSPFKSPSIPFEGQSRYKEDYKAPPPPSPDRAMGPGGYPSTPPPPRIPFEGESHSKSAYKPPPPEAYGAGYGHGGTPSRSRLATPSIPFEGESQYKKDYPAHPIEAITQHRPGSALATPPRAQLVPDTRDFMTASKAAYTPPPPPVMFEEIEGRLRVILNRDATVTDLQRALEERTLIPVEAQNLVRHQDGRTLNEDPNAPLVDALGWKSGEHLTLVNQFGHVGPRRVL